MERFDRGPGDPGEYGIGLHRLSDFDCFDLSQPLGQYRRPGLPALRRQVRERGVSDRVTFLGPQPRDDMAGLISAFDIALQPGVTAYASPLKTFEYMTLGRAIVAPDSPNMREILSHGETALLFDPDSTGAFEQTIERLVNDLALRTKLGASARAAIVDHDLTWENTARKVVALAEHLIGPSKPDAT